MQVPGRADDDLEHTSTFERSDLYCGGCYRDDGQMKEAFGFCQNCQEHLCESCFRYHCKPKPSANHVLLDKEHMPKVMSTATGAGPSSCLSPCPKHKDKFIEFYCTTHKKVICYVCSNVDHNQCQKEYIPDVAASYLKKKEFKDKLLRIPALRAKCEHIAKDASNNLDVAEKNATKTLEDFMTYKGIVIEALERQEVEIRQTKETFQAQAKKKADAIITSFEDIGSKLTKLESDAASDKQEVDNSMKIFIHTINSQDQLDQYEHSIDQVEKEKVPTDIIFNLNQSVVEMAESNEFLGKIEIGSSMTLSADTEAKKVNSIHVRTAEDKGICWITGMTNISDSSIAISDYNNSSIKVVDTDSGKITQRLQLTFGPWDLTTLPDDKLAATLCKDSSIQVLTTKTALKQINKLACKYKKEPRGIHYHQGQLIVSYTGDNHMVEILSLEGKVIRTVVSGLKFPYYLTVDDDGEILVSGGNNNRVLKLDQTGNISYSYKHTDLMGPRGVVICRNGKFIVCSYGPDTVHLVSDNGTKSKTLIDNTHDPIGPYSCLIDERKRLLYISTHLIGGNERDNYLHVFKLQ